MQLAQNDDGSVCAEELAKLRRWRDEAVEAEDFRRAAHLHDLEAVLRPAAPRSLAEYAPADEELQLRTFLDHGFCVIEDVLAGDALRRAQAAWLPAEQSRREQWQAAKVGLPEISAEEKLTAWAVGERKPLQADRDRRERLAGYVSFFDLDRSLQEQEEFVEMALSPKLLPLLSRVCGDGGLGDEPRPDGSKYHGICRYAGDMVMRCVPPEGHESAGYTSWHRGECSGSLVGFLESQTQKLGHRPPAARCLAARKLPHGESPRVPLGRTTQRWRARSRARVPSAPVGPQ